MRERARASLLIQTGPAGGHGVERRWDGRDRDAARAQLPEEWREDFIVASLGALQPHKRVSVLLDGAARARERGAVVRVILIGEERPRELDLSSEIRRLDLEGSVEITGWVEEERAHAERVAEIVGEIHERGFAIVQILEGERKTTFEQTQSLIRQNREALTRGKMENRELRIALAQIQKDAGAAGTEDAETARLVIWSSERKMHFLVVNRSSRSITCEIRSNT